MLQLRRPGALGWILVVISVVIGFATPAASAPQPSPSIAEWLLFVSAFAFAFGFVVIPLLARAMERHSSLDWSLYLWLLSGIAPLAFQTAAFARSVLGGTPNWGWLVNAACPLGVSLALMFPREVFESDRNVL